MITEERIIAAVAEIIPDQSFIVLTEEGLASFGWPKDQITRALALALLGACGDDPRAAITVFIKTLAEYQQELRKVSTDASEAPRRAERDDA